MITPDTNAMMGKEDEEMERTNVKKTMFSTGSPYTVLNQIRKGNFKEEDFITLKADCSQIPVDSVKDSFPEIDLQQSVDGNIQFIKAKAYHCSTTRAQTYLTFLDMLSPEIKNLRLESMFFMKHIVYEITRELAY